MTDDDAAVRRIESALARLGSEHVPPAGWESRVLARSAGGLHRRRWLLAAPALVAALALLIWWSLPDRPRARPEIAFELERGGTRVRGTSATLGDTLHATAHGEGNCALWIYRGDDEIVLTCPGASSCRASDGAMKAELPMRAVGRHSIVALCADAALPRPAGLLDEDVAAAAAAGAEVRIESLNVR